MIFNKNRKRMVDIRELQKRGVVRIPKKQIDIPTNKDGFIEFNKKSKTQDTETKSNADFFGFMNEPTNPTTDNQPPTTDYPSGYTKREVDAKTTDLDNKIYKLEQRIELLEKKLDVNQSTNNAGAMGW